jgi:hypothetical protein
LPDSIRTAQPHLPVSILVENIPYYGFRGVRRIAAQPEVPPGAEAPG